MTCPWCTPERQCWSCERDAFWAALWARTSPDVLAAIDRQLDEATSPERIARLGKLFGARGSG